MVGDFERGVFHVTDFSESPPEPDGICIWTIDGSETISIGYNGVTLKIPASELGNLISLCGNAYNYLMNQDSKEPRL